MVITEDGVTFVKKPVGTQAVEEAVSSVEKSVGTQAVEMKHVEEGLHQVWLSEFRNICMIADNKSSQGMQCGLSHLESEHRESIVNLVESYNHSKTPVYQCPRRMPYVDKCMVEEQIKKWVEEGIIRATNFEYASPVVLVGKKDGSKRPCCDHRRLNLKILKTIFRCT